MWRNIPLLLLTLTLLNGCGFQLRSTYLVPEAYKTVYLQSDSPYSELTRAVKQRFKAGQVTTLNSPQQGVARVQLSKDELERKTLSLFADGQVAEYRLFYSATARVFKTDGVSVTITLQAQRDYLDDPNQALAKSREMDMLLHEMRVEIADQLLRKLAAIQE